MKNIKKENWYCPWCQKNFGNGYASDLLRYIENGTITIQCPICQNKLVKITNNRRDDYV